MSVLLTPAFGGSLTAGDVLLSSAAQCVIIMFSNQRQQKAKHFAQFFPNKPSNPVKC